MYWTLISEISSNHKTLRTLFMKHYPQYHHHHLPLPASVIPGGRVTVEPLTALWFLSYLATP